MKTGHFRVNLGGSPICRFRILSLAFVYSRLFSSFASAMTLEMSLDAADFLDGFGEFLVRPPLKLFRGLLAREPWHESSGHEIHAV